MRADDGQPVNLKKQSPVQIALILLVCLVAVYSLTYSGTFVTDDEHILSVRTISLAFDDEINHSRVIGNSRVFSFSRSSPEALSIEPGQAVVSSILARMAVFLQVGQVQALFLLNIWVTAFTAVVLFASVLVLGYSQRTAVVIAILFGIGSIAWPYSRTCFRDPLAMLFLSCAWFCAQLLIKTKGASHKAKSPFWLWLGFISFMVAGVLTKNTVAIAIPVLLLEILLKTVGIKRLVSKFAARGPGGWKKIAALIAGLACLFLVWFMVVPQIPLLVRASPKYYSVLLQRVIFTPPIKLWNALAGTLLGSGKSIFLFSPILVLSFYSLFSYWKSTWSGWLYLSLLVVGQAMFYGEEWAGYVNWGLRFTLPAIPMLVLTAAPVVETCLKGVKRQFGLFFLGMFSLLIQLLGVLTPISKYYVEMASVNPPISARAVVWNAKHSILAWGARWIFSGGTLEIAAARLGMGFWPIWLCILLIGIGAVLSIRFNKRKGFSTGLLVLGFGVSVILLFVCKADPAYYPERFDLKLAQQELEEQYRAGDLVLIKSYGSPVWHYWMNWSDPHILWTALPFSFPEPVQIDTFIETQNPEDALDAITLSLMSQEIQSGQRVWLVVPGDSPGAGLGMESAWLEARSSMRQDWWYQSGQNDTHLYLFEIK